MRCLLRHSWRVLALVGVIFSIVAHAQSDPASSAKMTVREVSIDGAIGPASSRYIASELDAAAAAASELVILRLDTPGGLDSAMRDIVQAIMASPVPVAGYVAPAGARAASAGTYILYATHIAAMAPATNLGAATPVSLGGGQPSEPAGGGNDENDGGGDTELQSPDDESSGASPVADNATAKRRKAVNDAVAYIRSLAEARDRNADWAARAVREGVSLSAADALERGVIDHVADNRAALLATIDGDTVETAAGERTLNVADAAIETRTPGWTVALLSIITNPTVAYLLFMVGIYGLILEGLNPGAAMPGVVGAISLLCALFAFQILPVNFAGLALIALGGGLMVAEMFAPSFGILGVGGLAAFVFGSIMLMDTDVPGFDIPFGLIGALALASALLLLLIIYLFARSRQQQVETGHDGLVGRRCTALDDFEGEGRVWLHGESWLARCAVQVRRDDPLIVTGVDGLTVFVRPAHPGDDPSLPGASNIVTR